MKGASRRSWRAGNRKFLLQLMKILLNHNISTFNEEHFQQEFGVAMGSPPVPPYANIFTARKMFNKIRSLASNSIQLLKRFLDDLFPIFNGTTKDLHIFCNEINQIRPTIKFTMNHTSLTNEPDENRCPCPH